MTGPRMDMPRLRSLVPSSLARRRASGRRSRFGARPLESLESRQMLAANPIVSEFMAINAATIQDQDGDYSDWLELGNSGDAPIDLGGHYLTNAAGDLDRWQIPAGTVLDPDEYLVVFASGKNRAIAGSQLHTNFTLSEGGAGSFLALVAPNGTTLVNSFSDYPSQVADHSYGRLRRLKPETYVERGDAASYLIPNAADNALIGNTWKNTSFVPGAAGETGWTNGNVAIGYETLSSTTGFVVTYHKSSLQLTNLALAENLIFNGTGRVGAPVSRTDPTVNILNSGGAGHYFEDRRLPTETTADIEDFALHAVGTIFVTPENAGAWTIGINADDGTRVRIDGTVVLNDDVLAAPHDAFAQTVLTAGTHTLELTFFERGGGAEVELFAAKGTHTGFDSDFFRLIGDAAAGGLPTGGLDQVLNTDVQSAMHNVNGSAYVRVPFTVAAPDDVLSLSAQFEYDDGYVAYLNGTEISRQNAPASPAFNSSAAANSGLAVATIDLAGQVNLLVPGQNVLAIHALNASPSDGDFYINPKLTVRALQPEVLLDFDEPTPGTPNGLLDPVISEFLADNNGTIDDEDGDASDFIEIHNPGDLDIELDGYYLTNDPNNLTKWRVPDVTLAPADQLLIFASEKNRADAAGELHTNFSLPTQNGYLALVKPDGLTKVSEYKVTIDPALTTYPEQAEDISYGFEGSTFSVVLVPEPTTVFATVPTAANPAIETCTDTAVTTCWRNLNFDTTGWLQGTTAVGSETGTGYQALLGLDLRSLMRPAGGTARTTAYIRIPFTVDDPAAFGNLTLRVKYDDGFSAFINGIPVASANAPPTLAFNSTTAGGATHDDAQAVIFQDFDITSSLDALQSGPNVLAIHGLDAGPTSSDFIISASLVAKGSASLSDILRYFPDPTPGTPNELGVLGFVGETQILKEHGIYEQPITVHISNNSPGLSDVQLRYTTNGNPPTPTTGTVYTGPITISGTTVLRAAAFKTGYQPSNIATATFIFLADVMTQTSTTAPPGWPATWGGNTVNYGMDAAVLNNPVWGNQFIDDMKAIPVWSIAVNLDDLFNPSTGIYANAGGEGRAWERPASIEVLPFNGSQYQPDTEQGFQQDSGIRIRGGFSRSTGNPKHAFRFFFRREYGDGRLNYPLFGDEGADEFDKVDLKTSQNYSWAFQNSAANTFTREIWSRYLQRDFGIEYTRGRFYHVFINGQYWGLFDTQERSEADFGETYLGGDSDSYDTVKAEAGPYNSVATDGTMDEWKRFFCAAQDLSYPAQVATRDVANCGPAPIPMTDAQRYEAYMRLQGLNPDGTRNPTYNVDLDVDNLIIYNLGIIYAGNADAPISNFIGNNRVNNWFGVRQCSVPPAANPNRVCEGELGWQFYLHDNEHTLGTHGLTFDRTGPWTAVDLDTLNYSNPQTIWEYLWSVREFRMRIADLLHQAFFNGGQLTVQENIARFREIAAQVGSYTTNAAGTVTSASGPIVGEQARWGNNSNLTSIAWGAEIENVIRNIFPTRGDITLSQLRGDGLWPVTTAPAYSQFGGEVTPGYLLSMSAPLGRILYTTDGSDPRAVDSQGNVSISPTATFYNPPAPTYLDNGSPLKWLVPTGAGGETGWQTAAFVDSAWNNGTSAIGFDTGSLESGPGFTLRVVDTSSGPSIPNILVATDLLDDGQAAGYAISSDTTHFVPYVDLGDGGNLNSPPTLAMPGTGDREQYAVRATATVTIPVGTWSIAVGSDDGFKLTIPGITFTARGNADGGTATNVLQFSAPRAHGQTVGQFTTAAPVTANLVLDFYEAGGGDSLELSILNSGTTTFNAATFRTLQDGQFGWTATAVSPQVNYDPSIATDVETAMHNVNSSLYTRTAFTVADPAAVETLLLSVEYEDGFVAYLNGTEIARRNAPAGTPAFNAAATTTRPDTATMTTETINISAFRSALLAGNNVLAVQVLNGSASNPDLFFDARLEAAFFGNPVTISQSAQVNARALNSNGEWSPLTSANFTIGIPTLRVAELHYNPAAPTMAEIAACEATSSPANDPLCTDNDEYEFLELLNIGADPISMGGIRFINGITFTFPAGSLAPGARAVVAKNLDAFAARYGGGIVPAGAYTGNLSNDGERITIEGAFGEHIQEITRYEDNWYGLTDGDGYSLVIVDTSAPAIAWNSPVNWRTSYYQNGSPGSADPGIPAPQGSILINEVLSHTNQAGGPRIEFRNTTAAPINISGFYLSNDPNDLDKYRLPSLAAISAGGFLVIDQASTFGPVFALSPIGGTLILQGADGPGAMTGFQKQISYDGAELNVTQGPIVDSTGESTFEALAAATLGAANSGPRIGPIVINEFMYNPAFGGDEFIELSNISGATVSLAGWSFAAGVSFMLPSVSLAPGEFLVVTPNSITPAAFRTKYNVPASVQIVGGYIGLLDNGGEDLTLVKQGDVFQSIIVDRVKYLDEFPWPVSPDGTGPSLSKVTASNYGNDPAVWRPGTAGGTPGVTNQFFDETPPTTPTIMAVTVDGTTTPQVSINWTTASDPESAVSHYLLFRNSVQVGSLITGTSFTDATAAFDQLYTYTVLAVNTSGVASNPSSGQSIRIMSLANATQVNATQLRLSFSQTLNEASAENVANYFITNGVTVNSATMEATNTSVLLNVSPSLVQGQGYRVVVNNIVGAAAGTVMIPNANRVFTPGVSNGLVGEYYDSTVARFDNSTTTTIVEPAPDLPFGTKVGERVDSTMSVSWILGPAPAFTPPLPTSANDTFGFRQTGRLLPPVSGAYTFSFVTQLNDGVRFWLDADDDGLFEESERLINAWPTAVTTHTAPAITLVGGESYNIRIEAYDDASLFTLNFRWLHPNQATAATVPAANLLTPTALETDPPAAIGNVTLRNSAWSPAVLAAIQAAGLGTGGVTIPLGGTTPILPWTSGINQISVRFDEDVAATTTDLVVNGVNVASYNVASVAYDPVTSTATWTLAQPIQTDRVTISFAGVEDLAGNDLSGASTATVRALAGDSDRDGDVDNADFQASRTAQFTAIGGAGYGIFLDTDANGAINILDWQNVFTRIGTTVPSPPAPSAAPDAVFSRVTGGTAIANAESSTAALPLRTLSAARARLAPRLAAPGVDRSLAGDAAASSRPLRASRSSAVSARQTASQIDAAIGSMFEL
jgi:hypothetical protein